MADILFDSRWIAPHGIGRVAKEYRERLANDFTVVDISEGPKPSSPVDFLFLAAQFRKSRADLLFSPGYNGTPLVGRRQVFMVHDLIHMQDREPNGWLKSAYYSTVIRSAARRATVLTVSETSAKDLRTCWPEVKHRLHVVHNGISEPFIRSRDHLHDRERVGIVLFGSQRWHKNLFKMLDALALWQAAEICPSDHPITIIGNEGDLRSEVLGRALGNVSFVDRPSDLDLVSLLQRSKVLLFCSLYEGFGLPVIEALASGCNVVTSDIPVMREVGHDCTFVDPNSPSAIAAGLRLALARQSTAEPTGQALEEFSWDQSYAQVHRIVQDLLRTPSS